MAAIHITKENFEQEVLNSEKAVLIDFWASWCGPCQMLLPIVEELSNEVSNAKICKINVDEEPELAEKFNVMSIPTLVVMKDKKVENVSVGLMSKQLILDMLNV